MVTLIPLIRIAGVIQLVDAAANVALPKRINVVNDLKRLSPLARQVFVIHWAYIIFILTGFGWMCLQFASELAGGAALARFICAMLAVFWLPRAFIQLFYFDREFRRQNRAADVAFTLCSLFLGVVFSLSALGFGR